MTRWALAIAAAAALVAVLVVLLRPADEPEPSVEPLAAIPADARWVSTTGSDANPGTRAEPWRSLEMALRSVGPGETVAIAPGTYGARGTTIEIDRDGEPTAPITIRGEPGQPRPRLLGAVRIRASHVRIAHLLFDGPTGPVQAPSDENPRGEQVQVAVDDDDRPIEDVWIYDSEIRGADWHAGIFLTHADAVRIVGNYIHDNGDPEDPDQANLSHGIYWDSGSGLIANNVIEGNLARGVQLYPAPTGVTVAYNTIVENGKAGVQVARYASDNVVVNNIVAFNGDAGIRSDALARGNNFARFNLLWENAGVADEPGVNLVVSDSIIEPPGFASGDSYELAPDSAAVDRAGPDYEISVDILGRSRPRGEAPDLGAYESW